MAFWDKEYRREFCMFAALVVGLVGTAIAGLNFSHNLGYWPSGNTTLPTAQSQSSKQRDQPGTPSPEGSFTQWLIFGLISGSVVAVGVLYYLGRTHSVSERLARPGSLAASMSSFQGDLQATLTPGPTVEERLAEAEKRLKEVAGPTIKLTLGSPQGGQRLPLELFTAEQWNYFALLVQNASDHWSACDSVIRLEFIEKVSNDKRTVDRAFFVETGFDDKVSGFSNTWLCLKATATATVLLAAWRGTGPVVGGF
jgi:hypothetical protein